MITRAFPATNNDGYRKWGTVTPDREKLPIYYAIQREFCPLILVKEPTGLKLTARTDLPSYTVKGYFVKLKRDGETIKEWALPVLAPGMNHTIDFTGYSSSDHVFEICNPKGFVRLIKSKKGNLYEKPSKLDMICKENNIEHRLTKPNTPKTNGMVERVNGTIKNRTIFKETYANKNELNSALIAFLVHYILYRSHGGLRKELNVKTPMQAIEKWVDMKPEIFKQKPL